MSRMSDEEFEERMRETFNPHTSYEDDQVAILRLIARLLWEIAKELRRV